MTIIDENTVVVYTSEELKKCLEEDNNYNYIYFGSNITLTSGITISNKKSNVTIDGTYNDTKYTYEDMKSLATTDTISVRSSNINKVTVKNINVTGNNYYGIIYVPEDNTLQNVIIEYNNLTYSGPQITYHPTGLSIYNNCDIKITKTYTAAQEVAECNRIEIAGTTSIIHESTSDSSFWFKGQNTPYFKILENANVTMQSINRELFYGTNNLEFSVLENTTFSLTTALGIGYGTFSTNKVLIDKNAYLKITQTKKNGSYPTWYCTGSFTMNENSTLIMINNYASIATSNYNIYFKTTSASLTLNSPKQLVLYNSKANVFYSEQTMNFNLTYTRANLWSSPAEISIAGSLDDLPTYSWYKNINISNITGTLSSSKTTITTNNYTEEELKDLPSIDNFKLNDTKVISFGTTPLSIHPVTDESTTISGYTEKNADVKILYLTEEKTVTANETGYFELTLDNTLPIGTNISFLANLKNSFIYHSKIIEIIYPGELNIESVPLNITFTLTPFSTNPILCPTKDKTSITIVDSRIDSSAWKLYAKINHDLETTDGHILTDSLVYIDDSNNITPLKTTENTLVYTGENNAGTTKTTVITWDYNKGIILKLGNEPMENKKEYQAEITWTLEE